jgi:radical SAM-linked protein
MSSSTSGSTSACVRVRIRFAKLGRVRWTSHRDVARMWERALRRARLPVTYTGGFSPRPQLSFGLALPTGCESTAEYLDASFGGALAPAVADGTAMAEVVDPHLPDGVFVMAAGAVEAGSASLQGAVTSCAWDIEVSGVSVAELEAVLTRACAATTLPVQRERKGRLQIDDLRPSVRALHAVGGAGSASRLVAELATRPRGVRPTELAQALGLEFGLARRTCQWIEDPGWRHEPLAASAASPDPVWGRAS